MDSPLGNCPKCGAVITDEHQYSWCDSCGEPLPSDLAARLPHVHAIRAWAEASTAPSSVPPPQKTRVVIGDIKMRFGSTTIFMFLRRSIAYLIDCFLVLIFVRQSMGRLGGNLSPLAWFGLKLLAICICWFYIIGSHARWGCTLGKFLCGLQVASLDGSIPPPLKNAFLRAVPLIIIGNLGWVMAIFVPRSWTADIFSHGGWHGDLWQTLVFLWVGSEILVALITGAHRSVHDIIGGTLVTKEVYGPRADDLKRDCHEPRPWLISFSKTLFLLGLFLCVAWLLFALWSNQIERSAAQSLSTNPNEAHEQTELEPTWSGTELASSEQTYGGLFKPLPSLLPYQGAHSKSNYQPLRDIGVVPKMFIPKKQTEAPNSLPKEGAQPQPSAAAQQSVTPQPTPK